jgi:hypothetical protein
VDHENVEYCRTIPNEPERLHRSTATEYGFPVSHPAGQEARQEIINAFAAQLRAFHLDCGKPSFARLDRRSGQTGRSARRRPLVCDADSWTTFSAHTTRTVGAGVTADMAAMPSTTSTGSPCGWGRLRKG